VTSSDLDQLRRWEDGGGTWRVLALTSDHVEIALFTCSGGEEMARLRSSDPALLDYVRTG
jgi:hypothetical protein